MIRSFAVELCRWIGLILGVLGAMAMALGMWELSAYAWAFCADLHIVAQWIERREDDNTPDTEDPARHSEHMAIHQ